MKINTVILSLIVLFFYSNCVSQTFNIGHTTINFTDNSRSRTIETEIYYPSNSSGVDVSPASGNFPVIVFGHGFLMGWDSYQNFWDALVPNGYVICFPKTEGGASPNHEDFGKDLKFIATEIQSQNTNSNAILFNALSSKTALMGHSMGGGASFLAAENNSTIHSLVNFAAAETTPSAINAAVNVTVPTLLFSGVDDCVTPPDEHQDLMYANLNNNCKTQINIIGASHCNFANNNFSCNLGETFCSSPDITREEQHLATFDFLNLWLEYTLKNNSSSLTTFNDSLQISTRVTSNQSCNQSYTNVSESISKENLTLSPNPMTSQLQLTVSNENIGGNVIIYDLLGQVLLQKVINNTNVKLDLSSFKSGAYQLVYINGEHKQTKKFIKTNK
jgi:dienelactone hydrolase